MLQETVDSLNTVLHNLEGIDGLHSTSITPAAPHSYRGSSLSVGAEGDSFYEYLLKQWLQTGKTKPMWADNLLVLLFFFFSSFSHHPGSPDWLWI